MKDDSFEAYLELLDKHKRTQYDSGMRFIDSWVDTAGSYLKIEHKEWAVEDFRTNEAVEDRYISSIFGGGKKMTGYVSDHSARNIAITKITLEDYKRYLLILEKAQLRYVRNWQGMFDSVNLRVDSIILKTPTSLINEGSDRGKPRHIPNTCSPAYLKIKITDMKIDTLLEEVEVDYGLTIDYHKKDIEITGETFKEIEDKIDNEINTINEYRNDYINDYIKESQKYLDHLMSKYNLSKQDVCDYCKDSNQFEVKWEYAKYKKISETVLDIRLNGVDVDRLESANKINNTGVGEGRIRRHDSWHIVESSYTKYGNLKLLEGYNTADITYVDVELKRILSIKRKPS